MYIQSITRILTSESWRLIQVSARQVATLAGKVGTLFKVTTSKEKKKKKKEEAESSLISWAITGIKTSFCHSSGNKKKSKVPFPQGGDNKPFDFRAAFFIPRERINLAVTR